jgi:hypothetical protein
MIVRSWLRGTDIEAALMAVIDAQKQCGKVKRELSAAKKQLARAFRD